jgi:hypothetical protein
LNAIETGNPKATHGKEGYYFGESGHHTLYDIAKRIGEVMHDLGVSKSSNVEPETFTKEEIDKYLEVSAGSVFHFRLEPDSICLQGSDYLGTNSRCTATRSRAVGWQPTHSTKDMLDSIRLEVETLAGNNV